MKAPKALLIDLDNTLIDYDGFAEEAWHRACEVISGGAVPVETLVGEILRYSSWYWSDPDRHREGRNNLEETRRITVREVLKRLGHPNDKMADEIGNRYISIREKKLHLFPDVRETLEKLKQRRMPMCLVANGESHVQRGKIERFLLEPYFAAILIEGELGYGKPDVRVFKRALDILGTPAEETWMIGDNCGRPATTRQRERALPVGSYSRPNRCLWRTFRPRFSGIKVVGQPELRVGGDRPAKSGFDKRLGRQGAKRTSRRRAGPTARGDNSLQ